MEKRNVEFEAIAYPKSVCHICTVNGEKVGEYFDDESSFFDMEKGVCVNCESVEFFKAYFMREDVHVVVVELETDRYRSRAYEGDYLLATWHSDKDHFWIDGESIPCKSVEDFKAYFTKEKVKKAEPEKEKWKLFVTNLCNCEGVKHEIASYDWREDANNALWNLKRLPRPFCIEGTWISDGDHLVVSK